MTADAARGRRGAGAAVLPFALFYLLFLVVPYLFLLRMSVNKYDPMFLFRETFALDNYAKALTEPFYLELMLRTVLLGLTVTLVTLVLAYPVAWRITIARPRAKSLLMAVALSPLLVNLVVRTYGWIVLLGDKGVINEWLIGLGVIGAPLPLSHNLFAVVVGLGHVTLPFMILSLVSVMEGIPRDLFEAAESLGGGWWRIFREVLLPLSLPGVGAGSMLVFAFCISAFVTPALLGGGTVSTVSTVIYEQFTYTLNWPFGSALVVVLLALNLVVVVAHGRLFRHGGAA